MPSPVSFENSPMEYSIKNHRNPLDIGLLYIVWLDYTKSKEDYQMVQGTGIYTERTKIRNF